jgi:hypothetical protein
MASQINPDSAPEEISSQETSPQGTAPQETAPEENAPHRFGASQFQRWGSLFVTLLFFLISVLEYVLEPAEGWPEVAVDLSVIGLLVLVCIDNFQRATLVGEKEIRESRLLWRDQSLQISEIRRLHVPTTQSGLWLYTDPNRNPALKIGAGLEDPAGLEEMVIQSLPPEAKITGLGQEERAS